MKVYLLYFGLFIWTIGICVAQSNLPAKLSEQISLFSRAESYLFHGRSLDLYFSQKSIDTLSAATFQISVNKKKYFQKINGLLENYYDGTNYLSLNHPLKIAFFARLDESKITKDLLSQRLDSLFNGVKYEEVDTDSSIIYTVYASDSILRFTEVEISKLSNRATSFVTKYKNGEGRIIRIVYLYIDSFTLLSSEHNILKGPLDFLIQSDNTYRLTSPFQDYQLLIRHE